MTELETLKQHGEAPTFLTEEGLKTLKSGYLLENETPRDLWRRVSAAAASYYEDPDFWTEKFFNVMWSGWLCLSTPVAANMGTSRGLPISCFSNHMADDTFDIFAKVQELAILSKYGGGVGCYLGDLRGSGIPISKGGVSGGIVPWCKVIDSTTLAVNQAGVRRGNSVVYLPIDHTDIDEFIDLRLQTGDMHRRCQNIHHAVTITDNWMSTMLNGDIEKRQLWAKLLSIRAKTGEPYISFIDTVNNNRPKCYLDNNLNIVTSNLCHEIHQFTDPNHTFVCCLSSLNLLKWDDWKDSDLVETSIRFLDGVMEEFIQKASKIKGFENSVRSAIKGRALGLGVTGWHSLLQSKMILFDSFDAMQLNSLIFREIKSRADNASKLLGDELGYPEWCKSVKERNTLKMAIAPTTSNSLIAGGMSQSIEPVASNFYNQKSAKGTFVRKNVILEKLLTEKNRNTEDVWLSILDNSGSVEHLSFLSDHEKNVFLTAREINQFAIVKQAAQRQQFIDQGQSLNLFFGSNSDPKYINQVHLDAWRSGVKGLYYFRSEGVLKGEISSRVDECRACES